MFKFVVLCAYLAAATAEPGAVLGSYPLAYSTAPVAAPLTTAYLGPANTVYQPAAVAYSTPYGLPHFIKKRSANFAYSNYIAPTTYVSSAPLTTTYSTAFPTTYTTPYISGASVVSAAPFGYTTAAHLIKKRSVAAYVAPTTYVAPTPYAATAPFISSAYAAPVYSTPYVATSPVYSSHFIKKRSAPLALSTYVAPTAYSTQTRVDYSAPLAHSYVAPAPVSYVSPYGTPFTHVI